VCVRNIAPVWIDTTAPGAVTGCAYRIALSAVQTRCPAADPAFGAVRAVVPAGQAAEQLRISVKAVEIEQLPDDLRLDLVGSVCRGEPAAGDQIPGANGAGLGERKVREEQDRRHCAALQSGSACQRSLFAGQSAASASASARATRVGSEPVRPSAGVLDLPQQGKRVRPASVENAGLFEDHVGGAVEATAVPRADSSGGLYPCWRRSRLIVRRIAASEDSRRVQSTDRSARMLATSSWAILANCGSALVSSAVPASAS
jgi:hypothetical protein